MTVAVQEQAQRRGDAVFHGIATAAAVLILTALAGVALFLTAPV